MPDKQLKGKQEAAEAGADDPAANDHYDKVLEQLEKDSRDRMEKAVSNTQEAIAKMVVRGIHANTTTLICIAQMSCAAAQCIAASCMFVKYSCLWLNVGPSHDEHESDERQLKKTSEEGKIAVRNVRRQVMQKIGRLARDGDISQDDQDRMTDFIQELTDGRVDTIEDMVKGKRTKI